MNDQIERVFIIIFVQLVQDIGRLQIPAQPVHQHDLAILQHGGSQGGVVPSSTGQGFRLAVCVAPQAGIAWISWLVPFVAVPNIACFLMGFASVVAMVDAGAPYP